MGYINKSYLQTQFSNFAARITAIFAKKTDIPTNMIGATASAAGKSGLAPAPSAGDNGKYLCGDGTWKEPTASVDTLTTMEQVEASTDDSKAVGAGAVKELSSSLLTLDYDNAVTLTPNASFTPNSNGYVIVFAHSTGTYGNVGLILGNSYASIQNNSEKWLCTSQQINGYNLAMNMIVSKGQTYYFHAETVTLFSARFVPFK